MKSVSITIPCRNEQKYIGKCLQSIVDCDYDKKLLMVFVCDGNSDDSTQKIVREFVDKYDYIKLLINEKRTTPFALNLGLKAESADVKIILGAHAEIYRDYIESCIAALEIEPKIGCSGGIIENVMEDETSTIISLAMSSSFGVGNAHFRTGEKEGYVDTVAFGAYKSEVFDIVGYFDEDLIRNQDDEFNYRLHKFGYKIYLSKSIKSKYYVRASYKKLYKQYYQYGYWKVYVNIKHNTITTLRQIIPSLFVSFLFTGLCLSLISNLFFKTYILGLSFYLLVGFISALKKTSSIFLATKVLFVFIILHFSYGLGYLLGIIQFIIFRKGPSEKSETLTR
jgi:glycosyltransferase involved in cell wall biosynthesis